MAKTSRSREVRLSPDEKWRVEVDARLIHELRVFLNLSLAALAKRAGIGRKPLETINQTGVASLVTIAKLATVLQIQPGELIIWFAVPKSEPDRPLVGKGRPMPQRKKPGAPRRSLRWWTTDEDDTLRSLRAAGYFWREIAARMHRTRGSVIDRWFTITYDERMKAREETDTPHDEDPATDG